MSEMDRSTSSFSKPPGFTFLSNNSSDSLDSNGNKSSNKIQRKLTNLMFHSNSRNSSEQSRRTSEDEPRNNSILSDMFPNVSNVGFSNVRTSMDSGHPDRSNISSNTSIGGNSVSTSHTLRTRSSTTTLGKIGKDMKFTRLMGLGIDKKKKGDIGSVPPSPDVQSMHLGNYDRHNSSSSFGTFAAKLKKPDNLSIQASDPV
ncbi:unnamed protein product [Ambrosiozyma monospora]|uniref:Unnamed protein product n=1 Tax=Ambrosiozyma monospora TaxID=43982 RepID=A0ACB5TWY0_AMBMO|nr:unnamed protein product [Ambrosiozyma monospora]